jgi:hypothetical protein
MLLAGAACAELWLPIDLCVWFHIFPSGCTPWNTTCLYNFSYQLLQKESQVCRQGCVCVRACARGCGWSLLCPRACAFVGCLCVLLCSTGTWSRGVGCLLRLAQLFPNAPSTLAALRAGLPLVALPTPTPPPVPASVGNDTDPFATGAQTLVGTVLMGAG